MDGATLFAILLAGGGVSISMALVYFAFRPELEGAELNRRLKETADRAGGGVLTAKARRGREKALLLTKAGTAGDELVAKFLFLVSPAELRQQLILAGYERLGPGRWLGISALVGLVAAAMEAYLVGPDIIFTPLTFLLGTLYVPRLFLSQQIMLRGSLFSKQFPEAIDLIVRGLKSGIPVSECLRLVGQEMPAPIGAEFALISDSLKLGSSYERAFADAIKRVNVHEFRFFAATLAIQRETGGNLVETLGSLSTVLRSRQQMRLRIRALASETRATSWIVAAMPLIMYFTLRVIAPDYMEPLTEDSRGVTMVMASAGMVVLGFAVIRMMTRIEI